MILFVFLRYCPGENMSIVFESPGQNGCHWHSRVVPDFPIQREDRNEKSTWYAVKFYFIALFITQQNTQTLCENTGLLRDEGWLSGTMFVGVCVCVCTFLDAWLKGPFWTLGQCWSFVVCQSPTISAPPLTHPASTHPPNLSRLVSHPPTAATGAFIYPLLDEERKMCVRLFCVCSSVCVRALVHVGPHQRCATAQIRTFHQ